MKKLMLLTALFAAALVLPAQAKPAHPPHPVKSKKCTPHAVGYKAAGTLVSVSLTQSAGAGTAKRGDDRYSGTLTVDVTKANHHAPTGDQTYTLANVRVRFWRATILMSLPLPSRRTAARSSAAATIKQSNAPAWQPAGRGGRHPVTSSR